MLFLFIILLLSATFCLLNSIQSKSRFHWLDPLLRLKVVIGKILVKYTQGLCGSSLTPIDTDSVNQSTLRLQ